MISWWPTCQGECRSNGWLARWQDLRRRGTPEQHWETLLLATFLLSFLLTVNIILAVTMVRLPDWLDNPHTKVKVGESDYSPFSSWPLTLRLCCKLCYAGSGTWDDATGDTFRQQGTQSWGKRERDQYAAFNKQKRCLQGTLVLGSGYAWYVRLSEKIKKCFARGHSISQYQSALISTNGS